MPCIRCGACADACPVRLLPQQLYWYTRARDFDNTQEYNLFDCIECGCCAYVCPSNIPLVHYYRFAKSEIWAAEREKEKADIARQRHEFRLERLEREKAERAARHKRKKAELTEETTSAPQKTDPKKAAIVAAMERVKAKKATGDAAPRNVDNLTEAQQKMIDEVDKRRKRQSADETPEKEPHSREQE
jgi:electron transport complex protein RnfC